MLITTNVCDIHKGVVDDDDIDEATTGYMCNKSGSTEFIVCRPCADDVHEAIAEVSKRRSHPFEQIPVATHDEIHEMRPNYSPLIADLKDLNIPRGMRLRLAAVEGVSSIKDLAALTDDELLEIPGIGPKSLPKVRAALATYQKNNHEESHEGAR